MECDEDRGPQIRKRLSEEIRNHIKRAIDRSARVPIDPSYSEALYLLMRADHQLRVVDTIEGGPRTARATRATDGGAKNMVDS